MKFEEYLAGVVAARWTDWPGGHGGPAILAEPSRKSHQEQSGAPMHGTDACTWWSTYRPMMIVPS